MRPRVLRNHLLLPGTLLLLTIAGAASGMDVKAVRAETNLEKRSAMALDEAEAQLTAARNAEEAGRIEEFRQAVDSCREMVELSYQSLQDTGKKARRSPKWFKRAEQRLLVMLRRIDSLARDVEPDDRPAVERLQQRTREIHDKLVQDIMSAK